MNISKSIANHVSIDTDGRDVFIMGQCFSADTIIKVSKARVSGAGSDVIRILDNCDEVSYIYQGRVIENDGFGWNGCETVASAIASIDR